MSNESIRTTIALAKQDISHIRETLDRIESGFAAHIEEDKKEFRSIRREVRALNKHLVSMGSLGVMVGYLFNRYF